MPFYRRTVRSSLGSFVIEASEVGLRRVIFPPTSAHFSNTPATNSHLDAAVDQLTRYFLKKDYNFQTLVFDFSEMADFRKKILKTLLRLPRKKISYAHLAQMAGHPRSARAVGTAMNQNPFPILIPCHFVIHADGKLGRYAFGASWKKCLVEHEETL